MSQNLNIMTSCVLRGAIAICLLGTSAFSQVRMPEPNPPSISGSPEDTSEATCGAASLVLPSREWTFHKTADGSHPSDSEQQMVWLMNRARRKPNIEGIWLAHLRQSNVQQAMDYWQVHRDILMDEFFSRSAVPPAAFDVRLYLAASNHSAYLISIDGQNHNNQFDRIIEQGFHFSSAGGSVFSYSEDAVYGHAAFNVDWGGNDGTGMQPGRGHRQNLMGNYSSVGMACLPENNPIPKVGPLVTTINYCNALTSYSNHYNRFIVGTVWNDLNTNSLYDLGEGVGSVTVMPDKGSFYAVTGNAGGYAIPVDSNIYVLTFSGGGLPSDFVTNVTVSASSVLVDCPVHSGFTEAQTTWTLSANWMLTYTLTGQRKGCAYRLSTCTNLMSWNWTWAGVLPSGYGNTLTFNAQLADTDTLRFMTLQRWLY